MFEGVSFKLLAFSNYLQGHPKMPEQNWKWIDLPSLCLRKKESVQESSRFILHFTSNIAKLICWWKKIDIAAVQYVMASRVRCLPLFESVSFKLLAFTNYLQGHPKMPEQNWKWIDLPSLCLCKKESVQESSRFILHFASNI